ncbi:NUMOD4 motif-containing HNH endonuclease [Mesorhizobium sp. STM 4661]|uniref:NUMOD4 motif-containing HNH endonuclease n=1 Tax=Mesorhizobium sp. STM 4661 TaxID=1297570 RepID=UPI0009DA652D|nr:NUMOD4 motif-containing HNH endonuclease [Mesorhizobium sp. STM 4661]
MTERWLPVVGFEGRYEVSDLGRVRSLAFRSNGGVGLMKSTPNYSGYHVVTLGRDRKQRRVHVMVLEAFVGPRPTGMQGCHDKSDKDNNRLDSLRWDTPRGNIADRRSYSEGSHPNSKLSQSDFDDIRFNLAMGRDLNTIAERFGVTRNRISQIRKTVSPVEAPYRGFVGEVGLR